MATISNGRKTVKNMKRRIVLTENQLKEVAKKMFCNISENISFRSKIHEVKYFHPEGRSMPNGSHYQRGGFLKECLDNRNAYVLDEGVHGEQYGLAKYRGGVITFSADINAIELSPNKFVNKIKQVIETFKQRIGRHKIIHSLINKFNKDDGEYIGAYSVGNFFKGKYVGDNGEMFNEKSLSVEVNGLSSRGLLKLAEFIANEFRQETVLVKDFNANKIFLVDGKPSDEPLEKEMERINTDC